MAGNIIAAVEDLFFLSKIRQTAEKIGIAIEVVSPAELEARLARSPVPAVVLDLNAKPAVDVLRALKSQPSTRDVPVLGFVSHVESDRIASARAAGCDTVLARSAFSAELPRWLEKLAGGAGAQGKHDAPGAGQ